MKARCLCDKTAIDINGEAKLSMLCHCEKCRMVSGLAGANVLFSEDDVEVTGDFIVFSHGTPNGDTTTKYTCKGCGVTVMRKASTTLRHDYGLRVLLGQTSHLHPGLSDLDCPKTPVVNRRQLDCVVKRRRGRRRTTAAGAFQFR